MTERSSPTSLPDGVEPLSMGPRVVLSDDAHRFIHGHAEATPDNEICGVLLGHRGADEHGLFVVVELAVEGKHADENAASVTFTHATWDHIYEVIAEHDDAMEIVGWYHSHPGFGIFFSSHDSFIHDHFFAAPWQVGLVVDPLADERGMFANVGSQLLGIDCYWRLSSDRSSAERVECDYRNRIADRDKSEDVADERSSLELHRSIEFLQYQITQLSSHQRRLSRLQIATIVVTIVALGFAVASLWLAQSTQPDVSTPPVTAPNDRLQGLDPTGDEDGSQTKPPASPALGDTADE